MPLGRDYANEYSKFHSSSKAKKDRASSQGRVKKGDGKDVDHRDGNPRNNSSKNIRVMPRGMNRGRDNNSWRY